MESAGTTRPRDDGDDTSSLGGGGGSVSGSERPSKRPRGLGSGGRGAGYSPPEVSFFLSLLEEHLPVSNKEWKAVVRLHNAQFPSLKRTPNSLRRKFSSLCRLATAGADESLLAPEVRRAVHAKRRMKNRGDVPEDDDDLPDSDDDDGENDDDSHNGSHQPRRESTGDGVSMQNAAAASNGAAPTPAPPPQMAPIRYYSNGQAAVAVAPAAARLAPTPTQSQSQFNNSTESRTQAVYERVSEIASGQRAGASSANATQADLIELIKLQLLQNVEDDRRRRQEEAERREEERRHREEERATREEFRRRYEEERARREQDLRRWEEEREESRRRHAEFMQVILSLLNKK